MNQNKELKKVPANHVERNLIKRILLNWVNKFVIGVAGGQMMN